MKTIGIGIIAVGFVGMSIWAAKEGMLLWALIVGFVGLVAGCSVL